MCRAHIQRGAVAAITKADGSFQYDREWSRGRRVFGGEPRTPRWLIDLTGVDYFGHITKVEFLSPAIATDANLAHVGRLGQLQLLSANSPAVSDVGLAHLNELNKLVALSLERTQVTGARPAHLTGLTRLRVLELKGTKVTDTVSKDLKQALPGVNIFY